MKLTKNKFIYGATILTISSIIAKVIGAFFKVPLVSMLGSKGLGIFQLIFPIYSFFLVLISGGISLGMSKLISLDKQNNQGRFSKSYLKNSIILMIIFGLIFGLILALISFPMANFQGDTSLFVCYLALIPALLFSAVISCFRGYFQGQENMLPSGISLIIEQLTKVVFSLFFASILLNKGIVFAVCGVFLGISLSELLALLFLCFRAYFYKKISFAKTEKKIIKKISLNGTENSNENGKSQNTFANNSVKLTFKNAVKDILRISFPIMLNSVILPLVYAIESGLTIWLLSKATISSQTATSLFGLEDGIVGSLIALPTVVSSAISTAILPSITKNFNSGEKEESSNKAKFAIKIAYLVALPCFVVFFIFGKEVVQFLYSKGLSNDSFDELKVVIDLVKINSISIVYVSLLNVITAILQATNNSFVPVKNLILACLIKLILTVVFVAMPSVNIYGLAVSDCICFAIALILDLRHLKSVLNINFGLKDFVLKPIICVLFMAIMGVGIRFVLSTFLTGRVLILSLLGSCTMMYVLFVFATRTLKKEELFGFKIKR